MIYIGIGSRKTPSTVLDFMTHLATVVAKAGWTLRSGHAEGADLAFEKGAIQANGTKEIYLPWASFNSFHHHVGKTYYAEPTAQGIEVASHFHSNWNACNPVVRKLMGRNTHQVSGYDCNTPADLVICWTPEGSGSGGTGQAIRIANYLGIPVYDLARKADQTSLAKFMKEHGI